MGFEDDIKDALREFSLPDSIKDFEGEIDFNKLYEYEDAALKRLEYEKAVIDDVHYGRYGKYKIKNDVLGQCFIFQRRGEEEILRISYRMLNKLRGK